MVLLYSYEYFIGKLGFYNRYSLVEFLSFYVKPLLNFFRIKYLISELW